MIDKALCWKFSNFNLTIIDEVITEWPAELGLEPTPSEIDVIVDEYKLYMSRKKKIEELKQYRDDETKNHKVITFNGANNKYTTSLPVVVNKSSIEGANNLRDQLGGSGVSSTEWYFDDGTSEVQRTEKLLNIDDLNEMLKKLIERDIEIRRIYHKKEAEIFALTNSTALDSYDVTTDARDGTKWPS